MGEVFDEHPYQGIVFAAGPGYDSRKVNCKKGDHVYLKTLKVREQDIVLIEGIKYFVTNENNIICKVR
jgi:co-chaperonin GroES (HSP10)